MSFHRPRRPRAFWIAACNLVGLALSLTGVVLLFFYALPVEPPLGPHAMTDEGMPGGEAQLAIYRWHAGVGLILVCLGTIMEAVPPLYVALGSARRRSRPPTA
jgi:hypothetical protein